MMLIDSILLSKIGGDCLGLDNLPDVLTVKELSEFIKVSDQTVVRAIKEGKLKAFKVGREWRIEKESVLNWVKK